MGIRVLAAAKVNLALDVLGRRKDGYHEVDMIMQSVSVYDELIFEASDELLLCVNGDAPGDESNLVLRAARKLQEISGCRQGARLSLSKHIPTAAGLGGGSADAAATLYGLRCLWNLSISDTELLLAGGSLGVDVPFCMIGGTMHATDIGTTLSPLPAPPDMTLLLYKPCEGILTKKVYSALRLELPYERPDIPAMIQALSEGRLDNLCAAMGNALESVTLSFCPLIGTAIARLLSLGARNAHMSGSGSSVFGIFETKRAAETAYAALGGIICMPVAKGLVIESI